MLNGADTRHGILEMIDAIGNGRVSPNQRWTPTFLCHLATKSVYSCIYGYNNPPSGRGCIKFRGVNECTEMYLMANDES